MNYIWDILLKADKQNILRENIKFVPAKVYSPYMEIAFADLNANSLPSDNTIEINAYYRFQHIFDELLNVNFDESKELIETFFDIVIHFLAEIDLTQGLCKNEYYKKFIMKDIRNGSFGYELSENINEFNKEEIDYLLSGLITLYVTGESLYLFNKIIRKTFTNNIVYISNDHNKKLLIYLAKSKTQKLKRKIDVIINLFLPINMDVTIYWDKHFGIIGIDKTMKLDGIVIN
ncbi:hypothetical protein KPL47_05625 [Clostridium estertheticum]|uniref:hypothetical protein n=1 Tax=Clostridium estertheticum TaxID=238834 RepID=UPI001C0D2F68|nr:hypothetical protein [Clostridium estertheticum]MBU3175844.1 hypothetical protein [Clostridium estertheticum]